MKLFEHLPSFDGALADSARLASVRRVTEQAVKFAEGQLLKIREPYEGQDHAILYAMNAGLLEATVEVLVSYLVQIAGTCKPDLVPGLDDLGDAP